MTGAGKKSLRHNFPLVLPHRRPSSTLREQLSSPIIKKLLGELADTGLLPETHVPRYSRIAEAGPTTDSAPASPISLSEDPGPKTPSLRCRPSSGRSSLFYRQTSVSRGLSYQATAPAVTHVAAAPLHASHPSAIIDLTLQT